MKRKKTLQQKMQELMNHRMTNPDIVPAVHSKWDKPKPKSSRKYKMPCWIDKSCEVDVVWGEYKHMKPHEPHCSPKLKKVSSLQIAEEIVRIIGRYMVSPMSRDKKLLSQVSKQVERYNV